MQLSWELLKLTYTPHVIGGWWFTFGATLQPFYGAYSNYAANPVTDPAAGMKTQGFAASFGKSLFFSRLAKAKHG